MVSQGQSPEDDEVTFRNATDWLNSKLDYIYFDENSQKWWTNSFYVNENKEVTIKQISAKNPNTANIKEKTYTIRTFRIQDINPFTIQIKEVNTSTGRFAKGQLLELHTFDGEPKIHKSINKRKATSTSFLHLSFPKSLTDSLTNYPQLVKEKFYEAVMAATKIYPLDTESNRSLILETLKGEYKSENGTIWQSSKRFEEVLKIEAADKDIYFGFDQTRQQYFLNEVSDKGVETHYFRVKSGVQLEIENVNDPEQSILFETFNSFRWNGVWYYRQ